ncbi:YbhB/YbcL family Raf kinase inhibitor-like protein [Kitasatospora sp. SolWspMP-SS2h]|uniref:YbhB/YbcL family Raf kinase inhibitor-like protein n=1 Tax=Kitasatospora sp. SolWspMP-SS2h TaxID=1305729 RepID=UPI001314C6A0|nr:YbhB/YbcL family Raf kinase inhibitor-like protein [Kitasatospora sp. SolWspMP-SS2h]
MIASRRPKRHAAALAAALAVSCALIGAATPTATADAASGASRLTPFTLTSPDFRDGGKLPKWTEFGGPGSEGAPCQGKNLAPRLNWRNAPAGTLGYALLVNDPDAPLAGGWHHWVLYDIPGTATRIDGHGTLQYTQGANSFDTNGMPVVGWGGPCPPATGQPHHYVFTLYALSTPTLPSAGLTYEQVTSAIQPYVLGATSIVGTFRLPA